MIKAIIFDLDGTICDTLTDLGECTNQALADFNLPPHKIEEYRKIVGNGVDTQMRRAIGEEKYTKNLLIRSRQHSKHIMIKTTCATQNLMRGWKRRWMSFLKWD